jgi:hypothetical protein
MKERRFAGLPRGVEHPVEIILDVTVQLRPLQPFRWRQHVVVVRITRTRSIEKSNRTLFTHAIILRQRIIYFNSRFHTSICRSSNMLSARTLFRFFVGLYNFLWYNTAMPDAGVIIEKRDELFARKFGSHQDGNFCFNTPS